VISAAAARTIPRPAPVFGFGKGLISLQVEMSLAMFALSGRAIFSTQLSRASGGAVIRCGSAEPVEAQATPLIDQQQ
jgi:hypothetical protein